MNIHSVWQVAREETAAKNVEMQPQPQPEKELQMKVLAGLQYRAGLYESSHAVEDESWNWNSLLVICQRGGRTSNFKLPISVK